MEAIRVARFFLVQLTKSGKMYPLTKNTPNGRKTDQTAHLIYQRLPFRDPPKFTQIGVFGFKIVYHLATLEAILAPNPTCKNFV
jgi:hypothetical protein